MKRYRKDMNIKPQGFPKYAKLVKRTRLIWKANVCQEPRSGVPWKQLSLNFKIKSQIFYNVSKNTSERGHFWTLRL